MALGMSVRRASVLVVHTLLIVGMSAAAFGQTRASLTGVVKDGSGAVIPGATVTATSPNLVDGYLSASRRCCSL